MGKAIVAVVALAIISFVLTDLLGGQNSIFGGNDRSVGEIAGETVSVEEYQATVDQMAENYRNNFGRNPGESELSSIREQAWQLLIVQKAFSKVYDEVGVSVGTEELVDMVQGKNISAQVQQVFINQQTGQFDKNRLIETLNNLNATPQGRQQWSTFEESLIPGRLRIKFDNLIGKSTYITRAEAEREYEDQTSIAEAKYLYVPNYSISDSLVTVSDTELQQYIDNHPDDFESEWTRSINYVSFPIIASEADSIAYREELREEKEIFETVEDDSVYAKVNTDGSSFFNTYHHGTLPLILRSNLTILKEGDVLGPYIDANSYILYKMSRVYEDTIGNAKASHILFNWEDDSDEAKSTARSEANRVLREIKAGGDFVEMAKEHSKDGSNAINGGDLGWFESGTMVDEFNDAVFSATKTGLISKVIETQFGFHIINVTEVPTYTKYKVATITREITAGDETRDKAFRKADYFASTVEGDSFNEKAVEDSLMVLPAASIGTNDQSIQRIGRARQIVTWLFREASMNEVSTVFEMDDEYVVAVMTGEVEEGTANIDDVRVEVTAKVKDEKSQAEIIKKLNSITGTLDEIASSYGTDATVYTSSDIKISASTLPSVGPAAEAIGVVFSMNAGDVSEPIATDNGVVIIEVQNITLAPEVAEHGAYATTLGKEREDRASYHLGETIKEQADIKDEKYKFY